jgi:hypothetical protein
MDGPFGGDDTEATHQDDATDLVPSSAPSLPRSFVGVSPCNEFILVHLSIK